MKSLEYLVDDHDDYELCAHAIISFLQKSPNNFCKMLMLESHMSARGCSFRVSLVHEEQP